jgi:hypothetical protein
MVLQNRNEKIAKIQIENSKLNIDQQSLALNAQLATSYQTYVTNLVDCFRRKKTKL